MSVGMASRRELARAMSSMLVSSTKMDSLPFGASRVLCALKAKNPSRSSPPCAETLLSQGCRQALVTCSGQTGLQRTGIPPGVPAVMLGQEGSSEQLHCSDDVATWHREAVQHVS